MASSRVARLMAGLALGAALLFSQKTGGNQTGPQPAPQPGSPNAPTTTTTTPNIPTQQPTQQQHSTLPEMQRPIFLSGKVLMDDGTPPPDPVVIERVCNGFPRPEAYTDAKGHFSFQLGQNMNIMPDASVGSGGIDSNFGNNTSYNSVPGMGNNSNQGVTERELMGCEIRANLPGFRSDAVPLAGHRFMDNPEIGTIILHRLGNVEGLTISATSLMAPKDARKAYEKGLESLKKKKVDEAQKNFQKAVDAYPKYASAWFQLGLVCEQQQQTEQARKAYASALAADPKFVSPYLELAEISVREQNWQDAAQTTDRALSLNSISFPRAYFVNSLANFQLHKLDAAERSAIEAQKLDTTHRYPQVRHLLGMILAEKHDFKGAAASLRGYLQLAPNTKEAETVRKQLSEVEKLQQAQAQ